MINVASHSLLAHDAITCTKPSKVGHAVSCNPTGMGGIKKKGGESSTYKKNALCHTAEQQTAPTDTNRATCPWIPQQIHSCKHLRYTYPWQSKTFKNLPDPDYCLHRSGLACISEGHQFFSKAIVVPGQVTECQGTSSASRLLCRFAERRLAPDGISTNLMLWY